MSENNSQEKKQAGIPSSSYSRFEKFSSTPPSATPPVISEDSIETPPTNDIVVNSPQPQKSNIVKSPFRFLPAIVLLATLATASYYGYKDYILKPQKLASPTPIPTPMKSDINEPYLPTSPVSFELINSYNSDFIVSFKYPDGFTLSRYDDGTYIYSPSDKIKVKTISLYKLGPNQREGTEPGDIVSLSFTEIPADKPLSEIVDYEISNTNGNSGDIGALFSPKSEITINDFKGYSYQTVSILDNPTHIFLDTSSDAYNFYTKITYSSLDPNNYGYQKIVDLIISSIDLSEYAQKQIIKKTVEDHTNDNLVESIKSTNPVVSAIVDKYDGIFASGSVSISTSTSSLWIAKKIEGNWTEIWSGPEVPFCEDIENYDVPKSISGCYSTQE